MADKPRLIEVAFPLKQASVASVHEKMCGMGIFQRCIFWPNDFVT
jgi:hypothetical protein